MEKGQKSIRNNIEDVLCPFTDWYCTQGANDTFSHKGSEANDIRGKEPGIRYPYYAPVDVVCVNVDKKYAFVWWQSVNKVRLADGSINYITILCGHDDTIDCYNGQVIKQGVQIGNMGNGGNATGVHCHIEVGIGKHKSWFPNKFGIYIIPNQIPLEKVFFMDNTNIILGIANWKYLKDINCEENNTKYINLSNEADTWRIYDVEQEPYIKNTKGYLKPSIFNGLSYKIIEYKNNNCAIIDTLQFGKVKIYINHPSATITNIPIYNLVK